MSLLDTTYPKPVTPWQCAGHVPLPKTAKGRVYLSERIQPPKELIGQHVPLSKRIARVLSEGPATMSEIREELSSRISIIRGEMRRMQAKGVVRQCGERMPSGGGSCAMVFCLVEDEQC